MWLPLPALSQIPLAMSAAGATAMVPEPQMRIGIEWLSSRSSLVLGVGLLNRKGLPSEVLAALQSRPPPPGTTAEGSLLLRAERKVDWMEVCGRVYCCGRMADVGVGYLCAGQGFGLGFGQVFEG